MFREVLRYTLERTPEIRVPGEAANGREALERAAALKPDVLLLDISMPQLSVTEALRRLAAVAPEVRTILLVDSPDRHESLAALTLGVRGIVSKRTSPALFLKSVRAVSSGEYWIGHDSISDLIDSLRIFAIAGRNGNGGNGYRLTAREIDIVSRIVEGYTNREIAQKLAISEQTVKHHLTSIYGKVGVSNRLELAMFAMQQRLGSEPLEDAG